MASDERPANLPNGRWLGDLGLLSAAEAHLVASCRDGVDCVFNKKRPRRATTTNKISAKLLRFLALGGDEAHPVHENGVSIVGGYISSADHARQLHVRPRDRRPICKDAAALSAGLFGSGPQHSGMPCGR
jgi:hypothetical protein